MLGIVCEILIIANCKFTVSTQNYNALYKFHTKIFTSTRVNLNMYKAWKYVASALFFFKTRLLQYLQPVNRLPSPNYTVPTLLVSRARFFLFSSAAWRATLCKQFVLQNGNCLAVGRLKMGCNRQANDENKDGEKCTLFTSEDHTVAWHDTL